MKKTTPLLVILFLFASMSFSQNIDTELLKDQITKGKEDTTKLKLLNNLSYGLVNKSDFDNSRKYANQAIALADKLSVDTGAQTTPRYIRLCKDVRASANNIIGISYMYQGTYSEALKYYSEALRAFEELKNINGLANTYTNMGIIYQEQGNYTEAMKNHLLSLKMQQEFGDKIAIARVYINIANLYIRQANYPEALKNSLVSLKLSEEIGFTAGVSFNYNNIGIIHQAYGNYSEALKNFFASLKIRQEIGDKKGIAMSYLNVGNICQIQGNYSGALKNLSAALKISNEISDKIGISGALQNIGVVYLHAGNNTEALKNFSAALKIVEEIGDKTGIASVYNNIGAINLIQYNFSEALRNFSISMKIAEESGDKKNVVANYNNIGGTYHESGNYPEALKNYSAALKGTQELKDKHGIADAYNNIAVTNKRQARYSEALKNQFASLKIQKEIGYTKGIAESYQNIANVYSLSGKFKDALSYARLSFISTKSLLVENFNSLTENEKSSFKNTVIKNSDQYFTNAYYMKGASDDSLQWLYNYQLFQRGIVLESSSGLAASVQQDSSLQELWVKFSGYKNLVGKEYLKPIDERRKDLSVLEDSSNNSERELLEKSISYRNWKERINASWQDVQKHLAKDEAAIEFVSFALQRKEKTDSIFYMALVLTPQMKCPRLLYLFEEKALSKLLRNISSDNNSGISNLYTAMRGVKAGNSSSAALQYGDILYQLIWQPLAPYLKDVKTISFVPDGLLNKINMAAIPAPEGKLLCNAYQLRQMASTRSIAFPSDQPKTQPAAFFGGIDYTYYIPADTMITADSSSLSLLETANRSRGHEFNFLKGTKEETEGLSNLYKTKKYSYTLIEGKNATEKIFKQLDGKSPAVLHIATHGFFFPPPAKKEGGDVSNYSLAEDPLLRSGLALAGGNYAWKNGTNPYEEEDGILTAYEISHLNLSTTDLVVLSACETGLGDIKGSEGVYGLQRAFKTAGVKYIVMSLWQVPDKETQEFMQTFYQKWLNGKPVRSAFRETQLEMSARYEPYQWAAFVMVE